MTRALAIRIGEARERLAKARRAHWWRRVISLGLWGDQARLRAFEGEIASLEATARRLEELRAKGRVDNEAIKSLPSESVSLSSEESPNEARRLVGASPRIIGGQDYPDDWPALAAHIRARDGGCIDADGRCSGPLQVHHIVPLRQGGTNEPVNLVTLCECHHALRHPHMRYGR